MFLALFESSTFIVREKAKLAFKRLTAESFSFAKARMKTPLESPEDTDSPVKKPRIVPA
jgi:hypothetical protein